MLMRTRRGFTLVELLIAIVVFGIAGAAVFRVVSTTQRVSQAQTQQTEMQSNLRTGGLVVPAELREMGYDTDRNGVVQTDIVNAFSNSIRFRAMRGWAPICGYTTTEVRIRKDLFQGYRDPVVTDGFLLFVENEEGLGSDDQWIPFTAQTVDVNSTCPVTGVPAIRLAQLTAPAEFRYTRVDATTGVSSPAYDATTGMPLATLVGQSGGPLRFYEVMDFGLYADGNGRNWLGARAWGAGEAAYQPVLGPLQNNGFRLRYFDKNGTVIPAGDPLRYPDIRVVEIELDGETTQSVSRAATGSRSRAQLTTTTRVALRNTLRP